MSKHAKDILPSGLLPLLAVIGLPALFAAEPASLIHRTDREVAFEVTTNGLSRITFQGRVLATGEWSEKRGDETGCDLHSRSPIHAGRSGGGGGGRGRGGGAAGARHRATPRPPK